MRGLGLSLVILEALSRWYSGLWKLGLPTIIKSVFDGELSHHMNTRVLSEPRYDLRKRNHSQQQQNGILLIHKFEKLSIHEMNEESLSKTLKESVDHKRIIFPPHTIIY